jgi:hypothetical protein
VSECDKIRVVYSVGLQVWVWCGGVSGECVGTCVWGGNSGAQCVGVSVCSMALLAYSVWVQVGGRRERGARCVGTVCVLSSVCVYLWCLWCILWVRVSHRDGVCDEIGGYKSGICEGVSRWPGVLLCGRRSTCVGVIAVF